MDERIWRAGAWAAAAVAWLGGLLAVTPIVGTFPLVPVAETVIRSVPGSVATRATDGTGTVKTARQTPPHPAGATGWDLKQYSLPR